MKKVVLGMSGGVDSSVAAYLLKKQGYEVIGVFMKNWEEKDENGECMSDRDFADVAEVANQLGIKYYSVNFVKEYYDNVFSYFLDEYKKGRTPNPDVLCNKEIKFKTFLEYAMSLGADYIATGHYAIIKREEENGKIISKMYKAKDLNKDQTYFLCQLNQKQIEKVLFPLGEYTKDEIRQIAKENNIATYNKKDSTGICFIGERNFDKFLDKYLVSKPGDIVDENMNKLGTHKGLIHYTIGQRKGIGIGNMAGSNGKAFYVIDKDLKNNRLIVTQGDGEGLYSKGLLAGDFNFIDESYEKYPMKCNVKFRYRQNDVDAIMTKQDEYIKIEFLESQKAVTEGQFVVVYKNDLLIGGGKIEKVIK